MRKKKKKSVECVYCGKKGSLTKDHIPPTNLFPNPKPSNLITVPSCGKCNNQASKDDEYFRQMIVLREDLFENSAIRKIYPKVLRLFERPKASHFSKKFINSINFIGF